MNHNVKYGLIIGAINVVYTAVTLLVDPMWVITEPMSFFVTVAEIAILFIAGRALRDQEGGYLSFGRAFLSTWYILLIAGGVYTVYMILQFNVISPAAGEMLNEETVNLAANAFEQSGIEDAFIDQLVAIYELYPPFGVAFLIGRFIMGSVIGGAILALIVGAIVKKREPDFE